MSKEKSDVKAEDTIKPTRTAERSALAECAIVIASTLLLGCKTRGQLDAHEKEFKTGNAGSGQQPPTHRKEARASFAYPSFGSELRTAEVGIR